MLGARRHPSCFVVQCVAALRHAVKLWAWVYAARWDLLFTHMVWKWVDHVLRFPVDHVVRQTLLGLQHSSVSRGLVRRQWTCPNNSSHRNVLRHLDRHGVDLATAHDRLAWQSLEHDWLAGANIFPVSTESFLCRRNVAYKGPFTGNKFLRVTCLILHLLSLWNWIGFLAGVAAEVTAAVSPLLPFCRIWLILDGFTPELFTWGCFCLIDSVLLRGLVNS